MICVSCKTQDHENCTGKSSCNCQHVRQIITEPVLNWLNNLRGPF